MVSDYGDRTLTRGQLEAAVAMLRDERVAHPVSPRQRQLLRWYRWSIWTFCASLVAMVFYAYHLSEHPLHGFEWPGVLVGLAAVLSLLASIVLCALNLKLMVQTAREMAIAIRTRLWHLAAPVARRPTWARRALWVPKAYGWLLVAAAIAGAVASGWIGIIVAIVVAAYFLLWFARRRLALLDDANRLAQLLGRLQADGATSATVGVTDEVFRKVAQIEERHLERKRATALAGLDSGPAGYALVRSRRLIQQLHETEPTDRLRIERCLAGLSNAPTPSGPPSVETIAVPDSGRSISFRRDAEKLRIEVIELSGPANSRPSEEAVRG